MEISPSSIYSKERAPGTDLSGLAESFGAEDKFSYTCQESNQYSSVVTARSLATIPSALSPPIFLYEQIYYFLICSHPGPMQHENEFFAPIWGQCSKALPSGEQVMCVACEELQYYVLDFLVICNTKLRL
jgi:hypothetical protein